MHFRNPRLVVAAVAVALLHFALCVLMDNYLGGPHGEDWGWFPVFVIDLSLSLLLVQISHAHSALLVFGLLGSVWWFALVYGFGRWILYLDSRLPNHDTDTSLSSEK